MDRLLKPNGLEWRRLDDGTLEIVAASEFSTLKLPALSIEGEPVVEVQRPASPVATPLVEQAMATTSLDQHWLDTAPLLGFNQIGQYAPNVYGSGQSLAIRGIDIERSDDHSTSLTVTFDGIDLGTRLLDDELVPLNDVTNLTLSRGPRTFESSVGSGAGAISLRTAAPAAEPTTSVAVGAGNLGTWNSAISWSGPLGTSGLGATIAVDEHVLPNFIHELAVPEANVKRRQNTFGRMKVNYTSDTLPGLIAEVAALALSGDSSDRLIVAPAPHTNHPRPAPFSLFDRNSYATDPIIGHTHGRGAAGFVRYEDPRWTVDAHASITTISRDVTQFQFPEHLNSDREVRRRLGLTVSDHPAQNWMVVAGLEHANIGIPSLFESLNPSIPLITHYDTLTDSASLWVEHSWGSAWNAGLGVRWLDERVTRYAAEDLGYAYRIPIPLSVVEWRPWADQLFSVSYGRSYSSGTPNDSETVYSAERSKNLELAWRAQWLGGSLHTTLSAFDGEINNRFAFYNIGGPDNTFLGRVRDRGLELEVNADLSDYWRIRAGIGLLSSRYKSLFQGSPTAEAPPQTATFGVRYGLAQGWYGAADAYHAAGALTDILGKPEGRLPPYEVLGVRAGYRSANWDTALIVSNTLEAQYIERIHLTGVVPPYLYGYRLGDPRRVELRIKRNW